MKKIKLAMYLALALLLAPVVTFGQTVDQYGGRNQAVMDQTDGTALVAAITQGGFPNLSMAYDNVAQITQVSGDTNSATIKQLGSWSNALQQQYYGARNTALIEQDGNGVNALGFNYATQIQGVNDPAATPSTDNFAYIKQKGNGNRAEQIQTGTSNNASLLLAMTPGISQDGVGNIASQTQNGNNNEATINQKNNFNSATQIQVGDGHKASVLQDGNNNICTQDQSGLVPRVSNVTQRGDFNRITVTQR